jgi:hypothetical protein
MIYLNMFEGFFETLIIIAFWTPLLLLFSTPLILTLRYVLKSKRENKSIKLRHIMAGVLIQIFVYLTIVAALISLAAKILNSMF